MILKQYRFILDANISEAKSRKPTYQNCMGAGYCPDFGVSQVETAKEFIQARNPGLINSDYLFYFPLKFAECNFPYFFS